MVPTTKQKSVLDSSQPWLRGRDWAEIWEQHRLPTNDVRPIFISMVLSIVLYHGCESLRDMYVGGKYREATSGVLHEMYGEAAPHLLLGTDA